MRSESDRAKKILAHIREHGGIRRPNGSLLPLDIRAVEDIEALHGPKELCRLWDESGAVGVSEETGTLSSALELLKEHQHGYVWIVGRPDGTREKAKLLLDAGYVGIGPGADSFEEARGVYVTNRGFDWLAKEE